MESMTATSTPKKNKRNTRNKHSVKNTRPPRRTANNASNQALYDASALLQKSAEPIWNQVHELAVFEVADEKITFKLELKDFEGSIVEVPATEFKNLELKAGDELPIYIDDPAELKSEELENKNIVGSYIRGNEIRMFNKINHSYKRKKSLPGVLVSEVKGGYSVALLAKNKAELDLGFGLRAFLPAGRATLGRDERLDVNADEVLDFKVKDFTAKNANIIVSRKELALEAKKEALAEFWPTLEIGQAVCGKVKALMPYGAFVSVGSLGVVDGFVHVSDMSWNGVRHTEDLLKVGQNIDAKIIEIDQDKKKIKLSIKAMQPDPWQTIKDNHPVGSVVEGDVVAIADFGAFIKLSEEDIEGLVHVSEMSWKRHKHPSRCFTIGQRVKAMVLDADEKSRRIALSTKALEKSPIERVSEKYELNTKVKTRITGVSDFGLFVELDDDVQGLVHIGEVSWTERVSDLHDKFEEDQEIEVVVTGFDENRQRISCSIKRVGHNPWDEWRKTYSVGKKLKVKVVEILGAGAICELEKGLTAFCPTKQLSEEPIERAQDVVKIGQELNVAVIECNQRDMKIVVSVRKREQSETQDAYKSYVKKQEGGKSSQATIGDLLNQ